jgi:hypothetical protein
MVPAAAWDVVLTCMVLHLELWPAGKRFCRQTFLQLVMLVLYAHVEIVNVQQQGNTTRRDCL